MAAVVENSNGLRPCRFCSTPLPPTSHPSLSLLHQRENETVQFLLKETVKKSLPLKEENVKKIAAVKGTLLLPNPSRAKRTKHAWSITYKKNKACCSITCRKNKACLVHHVQKNQQSMLGPSRAKITKHAWSITYKKNKACLVHYVQKEQSMLGPSRLKKSKHTDPSFGRTQIHHV